MQTREILERLIAFPTISRTPNMGLIEFVRDLLAERGIQAQILPNEDGTRANLYATVGPGEGGVMLSGHTDVVPVEGQAWTHDPFRLTEADGRYYGRGTADMKGFVACAVAAMLQAQARGLATPLHLALSFDEEIGCLGVRSLVEMLARAPAKPAFCIVGEPTAMAVATGHKGKTALRATCRGVEGHSALAPLALNALHMGADLMGEIRAIQAEIVAHGARDGDYDVPYTTLHVGKMAGGVQLNIVPNLCTLDFEIRNLSEDEPGAIIGDIRAKAAALVAATGRPEASIGIERIYGYPGLATPPTAEIVNFVKSLTGQNGTIKVAFGTEGGLFAQEAGIPAVVCGPGSMEQGHKPDEFVSVAQIARCEAMLETLVGRLAQGL